MNDWGKNSIMDQRLQLIYRTNRQKQFLFWCFSSWWAAYVYSAANTISVPLIRAQKTSHLSHSWDKRQHFCCFPALVVVKRWWSTCFTDWLSNTRGESVSLNDSLCCSGGEMLEGRSHRMAGYRFVSTLSFKSAACWSIQCPSRNKASVWLTY